MQRKSKAMEAAVRSCLASTRPTAGRKRLLDESLIRLLLPVIFLRLMHDRMSAVLWFETDTSLSEGRQDEARRRVAVVDEAGEDGITKSLQITLDEKQLT